MSGYPLNRTVHEWTEAGSSRQGFGRIGGASRRSSFVLVCSNGPAPLLCFGPSDSKDTKGFSHDGRP